MSDLPASWISVQFGDVLRIRNGFAFPSKEFKSEGVPIVRQSNLDGDKVSLEKCVYINPSYLKTHSSFTLGKGDMLIGMSGSIGKLCRYDLNIIGLQNQRTGKVEIKNGDDLDSGYVFNYLKNCPKLLIEKGKGIGVANISASDIESLLFPLPPHNEQRRIVAKLDSLLAHSRRTREELEHIPKLVKRYKQAVLAAAFRGDLTADWRDSNLEIESWERISLGSVIENIRYGTSKKCDYLPVLTPVLRIPNIGDGYIVHNDIKYAEFEPKETEGLRLQQGDILIIRSNGSLDLVGKAAIVSEREEGFLYAGYLIRLRPNHEIILSECLYYHLIEPRIRAEIELLAKSTSGVNNINSQELQSLSLHIPGLREQKEIVRRVEKMFKSIESIEEQYQQARQLCDRLEQATLAKAFRGELVPQDPNDEPASVLLERICAEKQQPVVSTGKKSRRKTA